MRLLALALLLLSLPALGATEPTISVLVPGVVTAGEATEVSVTVAAARVEVMIRAEMSWDGGTAEAECPLTIIYPTTGSPVNVLLPAELSYVTGTARRDGQLITPLYLATAGRLVCPIPAGTITSEVTFEAITVSILTILK